jgi:hypothetical protein
MEIKNLNEMISILASALESAVPQPTPAMIVESKLDELETGLRVIQGPGRGLQTHLDAIKELKDEVVGDPVAVHRARAHRLTTMQKNPDTDPDAFRKGPPPFRTSSTPRRF